MKKKTIVVLEVEYEFDETKTAQELAEQEAVCLATQPSFQSILYDTKLVSVTDLNETEIVQDIASKILERDGFFYITSVHRDDLEARGFDVSEVTDSDMQYLAKRMEEDYCNQLFHGSMEILAECMDIPKKETGECEDEE